VIVAGVIDSTTNIVEHPATVAERIVRFVDVLGPEHFLAGVDCGFQTTVGRDQVDPKVAWAKLESLAHGAELASREVFAGARA
jgi:5-methyltetrahydropteroyltriglutamate--homocysteine methyltransferase